MTEDTVLAPAARPALPRPTALSASGLKRAASRVVFGVLLLYFALQAVQSWQTIVQFKLQQASDVTLDEQYDDYVAFYAAGRSIAEGHGGELYDLPSIASREEEALGRPPGGSLDDGVLPYFNPPFYAAFLAPLSLLPLSAFGLVLFALTCALIIAGGLMMTRLLRLTLWQRAIFWAWYLSLGSVTFIGLQSQTSVWPLLGWSGFLVLQTARRPLGAGAALALALVKPQLVALQVLSMAVQKPSRLLTFGAVAAGLVLVSLAVAGPSIVIKYPSLLLESSSWDRENGIIQANMYGWNGFFIRLVGGHTALHAAATWSTVAATLLITVWACRSEGRHDRPMYLLVAGIVICASLLASVHLYRQDLVMLALATVCGAAHSLRTMGSWSWWPLIGALLWLSQYYGPRLLFEQGINVQTPMIVVILVGLSWTLARERRLDTVIGISSPGTVDATPPRTRSGGRDDGGMKLRLER
jgi:hypothetical protein